MLYSFMKNKFQNLFIFKINNLVMFLFITMCYAGDWILDHPSFEIGSFICQEKVITAHVVIVRKKNFGIGWKYSASRSYESTNYWVDEVCRNISLVFPTPLVSPLYSSFSVLIFFLLFFPYSCGSIHFSPVSGHNFCLSLTSFFLDVKFILICKRYSSLDIYAR
jgi:hypothetical protein